MAGEAVEVTTYLLYVDGHVGNGLSTIDKHGDAVLMGNVDNLFDGVDSAEGVGDMGAGDKTGAGGEKGLVGVEVEDTLVGEGDNFETCADLLAGKLPRDDVGVVFHAGDDDFVAGFEKLATERGGNKIDALGGATGEDYLGMAAGVDEGLDFTANLFVAFGGLGGEVMRPAVDVAVEGEVVVGEGVDDLPRFLSCGGIVEIDKFMVVDVGIKYGEIHGMKGFKIVYRKDT